MKVSELENSGFDSDFGTQKIEDGSFTRCSEHCCSERATQFATQKYGLFVAYVPFCKEHAEKIYHSIYNMPEAKSPDAECTLIWTPDGYLWRVDECPYCLGVHYHGGSKLDGDPRELLGHRQSHCHDPFHSYASEKGGYILIEATPNATPVCEKGNCKCKFLEQARPSEPKMCFMEMMKGLMSRIEIAELCGADKTDGIPELFKEAGYDISKFILAFFAESGCDFTTFLHTMTWLFEQQHGKQDTI